MKTTGTFFAVRDNDDNHVRIYRHKPKTRRERVREYSWQTGRNVIRVRTDIDYSDEYVLYGDQFKELTGRVAPRNKIVEIEVTTNPVKGAKKVFAARTDNYVNLFKAAPIIENVESERLSYNTDTEKYETVKEMAKQIKPQEGSPAVDSFCVTGFRRGTGLTPPKNKVTPLSVRVKNVYDIPFDKTIVNE